jgi:hypothetical protein
VTDTSVMVQKIITVTLARFATMAVRLATLVVSIVSSVRMALIPAIVVMIRRNDASRGQEAARDQRVKRKPHDKTHSFSPFVLDNLAIQRTVTVVSSLAVFQERGTA